jgi:hypothetical protein
MVVTPFSEHRCRYMIDGDASIAWLFLLSSPQQEEAKTVRRSHKHC